MQTSITVTPASTPTGRSLACVGAALEIKGAISGEEDLQIDGRVEGPAIGLQWDGAAR